MADVPIIQLDPYLAGVQAVLFGLQQAGLIPSLDPLDYIIGAFDGKPKLEDTEQAALRLQASPWWPLRALGTNLQIWVKNGVPLSIGVAAYRAQLSDWIRGTIDSLEPIVYGRLDPYTLDHAIWLSMTSQQGDAAIVELNNTIATQHALGPLPALPSTTPQTPPGVVPGTGPNDILVTTDGDELNDLQRTIIFQNSLIYQALLNLGTALNKPGNDQCCTNVVQSISNVVGQLAIIAAELSNSNSTQVNIDFTPLTTEIAALVTAIGAYPPALSACCAAINNSLGGIRDAITNAGGTDTTGIVDQLKILAREGDVKDTTFQALAAQGFITPQDLQTLHGLDWSDSLSFLTHTSAYRTLQKTMRDLAMNPEAVAGWLGGFAAGNPNPIIDFVTNALSVQRNFLQTILEGILTTVTTALKPPGPTSVAQINVNPDTVLADVVAVGLNMLTLGGAVSLFREGAGEQIAHVSELISGVLGFEELKEVKIGPLVTYGIARVAEMQARATFRQELPGATALAGLSARGLISPAEYAQFVPYTGLPGQLQIPTQDAAYHGLNARQMLRLIETGLFTQAEINDELTFSGMRPVSQTRMLHAAPYLATQPQRNQLIGTLEKAHIQGLMDDAALASNIDSAEANVDRNNLILQRNHWEILMQETKDFEAEYTTLYLAQVIDDATFRAYLGGIQLQPWKVNTVAAKAEARLAATLNRKAIQEAVALQKATDEIERKTALKNYLEGVTPLPVYTAALLATHLTAAQAAAWSDFAVLQKAGNVTWIYGMELSRDAATEKKARVTALFDQRKRQFITQAQFIQALQALGLNNRWINALDAHAEALLTPKLDAFAVPVSTN